MMDEGYICVFLWARKTLVGCRNRSPTRKGDDRLETGLVVLELELAAMQVGDRRDQAQPEPGTRLRPALFEPHESLNHAAAIGRRDARAGVGDREQNAIALARRL